MHNKGVFKIQVHSWCYCGQVQEHTCRKQRVSELIKHRNWGICQQIYLQGQSFVFFCPRRVVQKVYMQWAQNLICPALLLDSLDLIRRRKSNKYWYDRSLKGLGMCLTVPDRSSKQRVKGIQPVMHLLVITGLKEYPTMLCAYRKCVGGLQFRQTLNQFSL